MRRENAIVYRAENGRRYFTARAAAWASVSFRMRRANPTEQAEFDEVGRVTYPGYHWTEDGRLMRIARYLTDRMMRGVK